MQISSSRLSVSKQEWLLAVTLALASSVAIMYANFMSVIILGMHDKLGFSMQAAGNISSLNLLGVAAGAFLASCLPRRLVNVQCAVACVCVMGLADGVSLFLGHASTLSVLRAVHGVAGGGVLAFCGSVLARMPSPERIMGAALAFQLCAASVAARYLSPVTLEHGPGPAFGIMAALDVLAMILLACTRRAAVLMPPLPAASGRGAADTGRTAPFSRGAVWLAVTVLASLMLFQGARFMVVGYGFQIGDLFGYDRTRTGAVIAWGNWLAGGGAVIAAVTPVAWGRVAPLLIAAAGNLLASVALIVWGAHPLVFALSMCAGALFALFALPFHYGVCFALDREGRLGMWTGFISKIGLAAGSGLGALLMLRLGLVHLLELSAALVCIATLMACSAAAAMNSWRARQTLFAPLAAVPSRRRGRRRASPR